MKALPCEDGQRVRRQWAEQVLLPRAARKEDAQIVHSLASIAPVYAGARAVVTLHDVTFLVRQTFGRLTTLGMSALVKAAARRALAGRPPRVRGVLAAIEIAQLSLAISRFGLVFVADVETMWRSPNPAATVHALEWIARHLNGAVVALFHDLPPVAPPFDRILYGARSFSAPVAAEPEAEEAGPWIAPWRGLPHPSSEIEQRLARALGEDAELGSLFVFNAGVSLDEIVCAVNQVGAAPGDLVAILEALKEAGALRAELVVI